LPDEFAAYEDFSDNIKKQVTAVKLSPVERATIQAMRVRKLLGCAPSTTEVEKIARGLQRFRTRIGRAQSQKCSTQS
jgi:hypothetical protein